MSLPQYPSLNIDVGCWPKYKDGRMLDDSMDGQESERVLWLGRKVARLTLVHPYLNESDVLQLNTFYLAHQRDPFELEFRGDVLVCKFISQPVIVETRGWWSTVQSSLRGV